MMKIVFRPAEPHGDVAAPPSKSHLHRLLIASAISEGTSVIEGCFRCDDTERTLDCLQKCGVDIRQEEDRLYITGKSPEKWEANVTLDCKESASTLRLLLPLCLLSGGEKRFVGSQKLFSRPLDLYETLFRGQKITYDLQKSGLTVSGRLQSFDFSPAAIRSSQFVSGLLFAMPFLEGSRLTIPTDTQSFPYITLTERVMTDFGFAVKAETCGEKIVFSAAGAGKCRTSGVWTDPSGAAYFAAFEALGFPVRVGSVDERTLSQPDGVYPACFDAIKKGRARIDAAHCPDLVPILTVFGALVNDTEIRHTSRLSYKESDRAAVIRRELMKCGGSVDIGDDRMLIRQSILHAPAVPIDPAGDHRIAMAMSVLLTLTGGTLLNAFCVSKSMPDFFEKLAALGADFDVISEEDL